MSKYRLKCIYNFVRIYMTEYYIHVLLYTIIVYCIVLLYTVITVILYTVLLYTVLYCITVYYYCILYTYILYIKIMKISNKFRNRYFPQKVSNNEIYTMILRLVATSL